MFRIVRAIMSFPTVRSRYGLATGPVSRGLLPFRIRRRTSLSIFLSPSASSTHTHTHSLSPPARYLRRPYSPCKRLAKAARRQAARPRASCRFVSTPRLRRIPHLAYLLSKCQDRSSLALLAL
ncbi:hypothetical protein EDB89DRAFT_2012470 [Lactarius sanguifluus]|nr:hypothetical protein EDB89DRAFT_2012470 [Lactarius sanguifluus]